MPRISVLGKDVPDALAKICQDKLSEVSRKEAALSLDSIKSRLSAMGEPRGFLAALQAAAQEAPALIAEIKRASPSKGQIREDFDPPALARAYAAGGAICLSVLTDERYFMGHDRFLRQSRTAVPLPVLRKDFVLTPYQIAESRLLGADAVLLILAALGDDLAQELETLALDLGMDVLIEVHNEAELERAIGLKSPLLGINNRDLKSLKVDLRTFEKLAGKAPGDRFLVAESGIRTKAEYLQLHKAGAQAVLVGEALMREDDVEGATRRLLGKGNTPGQFTHFDTGGRAVMVDVGEKPITERKAVAGAELKMEAGTLALVKDGGHKKGDVLSVARLAGIMAAKRTASLIPLCHPLGLDAVTIDFEPDDANTRIAIRTECRLSGKTGVEMEALTATAVAALTIYDMCKGVDKTMQIENLRLIHKSGGRSGTFDRD